MPYFLSVFNSLTEAKENKTVYSGKFSLKQQYLIT